MGLHVIVDGYNFLNAQPGMAELLARDLEGARAALLAELSGYRKRKGHQVTAVFDGRRATGLPPGAARGTRVGGVVFSRPGQEADEVIREMAEKSGMRAVVVTADVALAESCRRHGAAIVDPAEFAALLAEGGVVESEEDDEEGGAPKKGPAKKAPKRERRQRLRKKKL